MSRATQNPKRMLYEVNGVIQMWEPPGWEWGGGGGHPDKRVKGDPGKLISSERGEEAIEIGGGGGGCLNLGEREGEQLGEKGKENNRPAVAVWHVQPVEADLDVDEDVVQGIHNGVQPPRVLLPHPLRMPKLLKQVSKQQVGFR